jgi:hypothetical protein
MAIGALVTLPACDPAELAHRATFVGVARPVTAAELGPSWRPGCPVKPRDLRLVRLSYWGFDDTGHVGELVVHRRVVPSVIAVFRTLWNERYPIRSLRPVSHFGGDDRASMLADNTSGFNCRRVAGTRRWSEHAFGRAIDLNPLENPWVRGWVVDPPEAARFANRTLSERGMIHAGDVAVRAFARHGWRWGGYWSSSKDYQHFSTSGR